MVSHIEILVEEPSMEAALRLLVPNIVGDLSFEVYTYQCKEDLLRKLPARMRGYANWLPANWRIMVIADRDDDHCDQLKQQLDQAAQNNGLTTRSQGHNQPFQVVNRIAIEELEAWFFGDWDAVCAVYPRVSRRIPRKSGYREPDEIAGGTWEAFERILRKAGYFPTGLRKIEASRTIAQHMQPAINRSPSFQKFRDALAEMTL